MMMIYPKLKHKKISLEKSFDLHARSAKLELNLRIF